jgi:hypothetical protein
MADNYNGVGGSFTIDSSSGEVKPTIPVADQKEMAYSPTNSKKPKGESSDGTVN